MLHRAASNAYSWWWASHIRTKQSKWLDNNLQDVEVKVENMLKLIEEDGDSFAQKAEMYYRKRPELIKFVEEFYRAYRALAERYDHISGELHKANKTLATVFPDQLQLSISDGEETSADKTLAAVFPDGDDEEEEEENRSSSTMVPPCLSPPMETPPLETRSKQFAGLSRESAQQEIDKLLKGILIFQTEKEFIKSCYESNLAKYWEIERKMTEMQKEVCLLQDHYSVSMAIEDDEARALMAATALKTCEAALVNLQEQQKQSMEEASLASERIRVSRGKLNSLKMAAIQEEIALDLEDSSSSETKVLSSLAMAEEGLELQTMCEKIKEHFEKASVEELAEKIDELADKIIGLEVKASSQTAQIRRLRNEADELQKNLQRIEDEKTDLAAALGSYGKLRDMEEGLLQLQFLESSVKNENQKLLSDFSIACRSFVDLSERFHSGDGGCSSEQEHLKEEEEDVNEALRSIFDPDYAGISENLQSGDCSSSQEQRRRGADSVDESSSIHEDQDEEDEEEEEDGEEEREEEEEERENGIDRSEKIQLGDGGFSSPLEDFWGTEIFSSGHGEELHSQKLEEEEEEEGSLNWQQMLMSGLEDREKLLLNEYTSILRNYKETKRRLFEIEKRHQQHLSETMAKIRDLKHASAAKDEEILSLRSKLQSLECPKSPEKEERESSPPAIPAPEKEEECPEEGIFPAKEIDLQVPEEAETSNAIEERFRRDIDGLLEENLEFWLRFSASFQHIQKLQASWKGLQAEILQVGGAAASSSDTSPDSLFKNLGKLQSELLSWLDENTQLKSELQLRFSSLGKIKEEMSRVLAESAGEEESQLTAYRATKFHGELLSMQQENNKVAEDLRAGLGTAKCVQAEVERAMARLRRSLGVVSPAKTQPHYHFRHFSGKSRVPLKSILLFGAKPKPKKPSLFSCMNPALQKQYSDLSPGLRPRKWLYREEMRGV